MKVTRAHLMSLFYLTIGWFGIEMAMALDATQFQIMLDQQLDRAGVSQWGFHVGPLAFVLGKATLIGLVLSLGPLAGITVQPFMGWLGDRLIAKGIDRRSIMRQGVFYALICVLLFTLKLSLWALIVAVALFFISFNALNVNYRAMITQTSNRRALTAYKGTISGFITLFSGLGGFGMFMLSTMLGHSPFPAAAGALILLVCFILVFRFAPPHKQEVQVFSAGSSSLAQINGVQSLNSIWHFMFYIFPPINLIPAVERRLNRIPEQRNIFRLFLVIFFSWIGIQALRAYFILFATKELHLSYKAANFPLALLTLVTVASALPLGKLADKADNRRLLKISLFTFTVACAVGYWVVTSMSSIILLGVFLGVSFAGMIVLPLAILFKYCPKQSEGLYSGLYNLFMSVPQLYSLFLTGWLVDSLNSYRMIFIVGAVSAGIAGVLTQRLASAREPEHLALTTELSHPTEASCSLKP